MGSVEPGEQQETMQQEYPSARLLLDTLWREFDADVERHRSLIARATTLLTVCISMLTLLITGLALAPAALPVQKWLGIVIGLLMLLSFVVAGAYSTWAVSGSQRAAPSVRDLRLPECYMARIDQATVAVAEGYADCVEQRRRVTDIIGWRVNMAARSLFMGLFFTAVLAGLVLIEKGV